MMRPTPTEEFRQFAANPKWYITRGFSMIISGIIIGLLSLISPDVQMLGTDFSGLPIMGFVLIVVGLLRCLDAYLAESLQGYILNMQGGILDAIVGLIIFFSYVATPERASYLIAGYLITQGLLRNILLHAIDVGQTVSYRITGTISIVLGIIVWIGWPTTTAWFLAAALAIDIAFRGWALIKVAASVKQRMDINI